MLNHFLVLALTVKFTSGQMLSTVSIHIMQPIIYISACDSMKMLKKKKKKRNTEMKIVGS